MKSINLLIRQRIFWAAQVAILVAVVLPFIGRPFWDDELFSVRTASSLAVLQETCRLYENNMVAYYVTLAGWTRIFGDGEIAVRSLSLLFAACAVVGYGSLARRFLSPVFAGISGSMLTLNPLFLYYAIEARGYSMLLLTAIVSTHLFLSLIDRPSRGRILLYVLVSALSVYVHYFGLLLLPVHAVVAILTKQRGTTWNSLLTAWAIVMVSVSPLFLFKPSSTEQLLWMSPPTAKVFLKGISVLFGGMGFLLAYLAVVALAWRPGHAAAMKSARGLAILAGVWIFLPLVMVFLFSVLVKPLFLYRYFIWLLPAAALLVGLLVRHAWAVSPWLAWLVAITICVQVLPAYGMLRVKGSGYRDAAAFIAGEAERGDAVIAYPFFKADHYRYYREKQPEPGDHLSPRAFHTSGYLPGGGGRDPDPDFQRLDSIAAQARRIFLVCNPEPREADARQNRTALPAIEQQLGRHFPIRKSRVFGEGFEVPTRVIIFSR